MTSALLKADTRSTETLFQPRHSGCPSIDQTKIGLPCAAATCRASNREVFHGIVFHNSSSGLGAMVSRTVANSRESSSGRSDGVCAPHSMNSDDHKTKQVTVFITAFITVTLSRQLIVELLINQYNSLEAIATSLFSYWIASRIIAHWSESSPEIQSRGKER